MNWVLITGAFSKIGKTLTRNFACGNRSLILHYNSDLTGENKEFLDSLKPIPGNRLKTFQADFKEIDTIEKVWNNLKNSVQGRIEILINNAAVFYRKPVKDVSVTDWIETLNVNLLAPAVLSRNFINQDCFTEENPGKIINILDIYADRCMPGYLPYAVSKTAFKSLTRNMAREAGKNFRINGISPGIVNPAAEKKLLEKSVIQRVIEPEAIAKACDFLIENKAITGQIINVDGGKSLF